MIQPTLIIAPRGIDVPIQDFQKYLIANLSEIESCFGRCYKNETAEGFIPEVYIGKKEYYDIMSDDSIISHLFFDVEDSIITSNDSQKYEIEKTANVRLIVFANLEKIYSISNRADEDLIADIEIAIINFSSKYGKWKYNKCLKKISNVFSNYSYKLNDNLNDMQPFFVCAFEFELNYSQEKC